MIRIVLVLCLAYSCQAQNSNSIQTLNTAAECEANGLSYCTACQNDIYKCYECSTGYVLKSDYSGCDSCGTNCAECTSSGGTITCTKCISTYILNAGTCSACSTGCQECYVDSANSVKCKTCYTGYALNYLGECKACSLISGCGECAASNSSSTGITCSKCNTGYYSTDTGGCSSCLSACKTCSDATSCSECNTGYSLNDDSTSCLACQASCKSDKCSTGAVSTNPTYAKCDECNEYYYADSNSYCQPCTAQCKQCDSSTGLCNDGQCNTQYYLTSSSICDSCPFQCATCPNNTHCTICNDRFALKSTTDVTCDPCPSNCPTCSLTQAANGQCGTCATGFYKDSNGLCQTCPSNCDACTSGSVCSTCSSGYTLTDSNTCLACPNNCTGNTCSYNSTDSVSFCTACPSYFVLEGFLCWPSLGCTLAAYNVSTNEVNCVCTSDGSVDITTDQANQYRGVCSSSGIVCDAGYYYNEAAYNCTACPSGCSYCNSTMCLTCDSAYRMDDNGQCQSCNSPCATCSTSGSGLEQCESCVSGYNFDSGAKSCSVCTVGNCASCPSSTSTCGTCNAGYTLSNNLCVSTACTVTYCSSCPSNTSVCTACNAGYALKADNTCAKCPTGCGVCTEDTANNNVIKCTACSNYYALNNKPCAYCGPNCKTCTQSNGDVTCTECDSGYTVDTDGTCKSCPSHCTSCTLTSCSSCDAGYGVSSDGTGCTACSTLTGVTSCALCTDSSAGGKCTSCTGTKILSEDQSYCHDAILNCARAEDHTWDCTTCSDSNRVVGVDEYRGKCIYRCYVCGSSEGSNRLNYTMCNGDGNTYNDTTECTFDCVIGIEQVNEEWAFAYRGCSTNGTCATAGQTTCTYGADGSKICTRCCDADKCNDGVMSDDAAALFGTFYLLLSSLILSRFL
ncbi:hypothetical protein LSH36_61g09079 [Paralvinella palmiformis]|uniref:EGF-like domain-containing protein n=1 Tax=Paralvinella palmiformis TaxID=53620 RepID=A0AAD9K5Y3_9ANNE|nr:hypothetical protein LSH36_61g09079 [Paralvinella palmiformis]